MLSLSWVLLYYFLDVCAFDLTCIVVCTLNVYLGLIVCLCLDVCCVVCVVNLLLFLEHEMDHLVLDIEQMNDYVCYTLDKRDLYIVSLMMVEQEMVVEEEVMAVDMFVVVDTCCSYTVVD